MALDALQPEFVGWGPSVGQGGVDGQIPPAGRGLHVCGEGGAPTVCAPGRHGIPHAPAAGALPRAMEAAPRAAGRRVARCLPIGLPPPSKTRAAAPTSLSALAAPAGAVQLAKGSRQRRRPRGNAAAGGRVCMTPGPTLCRLRAAGHRALQPEGSRRAPHGCGSSARGGASAAGLASARASGGGRLHGGVPCRAGLAKRAQAPRSRSPS